MLKFLHYIESVIFKYWLSGLVFLLVLFKREVPKEMLDEYKKFMEEVKYLPSTDKDNRY